MQQCITETLIMRGKCKQYIKRLRLCFYNHNLANNVYMYVKSKILILHSRK